LPKSQGTDAYINSILVDTIGPGFHAYNWKRVLYLQIMNMTWTYKAEFYFYA